LNAEVLHLADPDSKAKGQKIPVAEPALDTGAWVRGMCLPVPDAGNASTVVTPAAVERITAEVTLSGWKPSGDGAEMPGIPESLRR